MGDRMGDRLSIFTIPVELAERALTFCHPWDVAAFSQSCRAAHTIVYKSTDQYLWRELFISHPFDDPRKYILAPRQKVDSVPSHVEFDWKPELMRRMTAERIFMGSQAPICERKRALETFISVVQEAPPAINQHGEMQPSNDIQWLERVIQQSHILAVVALPDEARLLAQLRSYAALSIEDGKDRKAKILSKERRNKSRSFVYDLRNYHSDNSWGPYLDDGRVNWIHIESLINVILMNLRELPGIWAQTRPPSGLAATRAYSAPGDFFHGDWAGVEGSVQPHPPRASSLTFSTCPIGTWRRYVCFMDYRDLFAFNYSDLASGSRDPSFFEDPRFREATRLIEVKLHLVPKESMRFRHLPEPKPISGVNDPYPALYFSGSSRGVNGNEAVVEGVVRMGRDGVPRWQFASIYAGHMQWSSHGAQVGNAASALGVVGVWTTAHHDQGDPVGPFWLWKVEDGYPANLMEYT